MAINRPDASVAEEQGLAFPPILVAVFVKLVLGLLRHEAARAVPQTPRRRAFPAILDFRHFSFRQKAGVGSHV
jgi:hypothetical protein